MEEEARVQRGGSSCALQGCLIGSVTIFVVLLLIMIFLAYGQFRRNTGPDAPSRPAPPTGFDIPPTGRSASPFVILDRDGQVYG